MSTEVFPCPVFEGSEKRISVHFSAASSVATAMLGCGAGLPGPAAPPHNGLRALSRGQLDEMLDLAACQIVSTRSNEFFDAYVLSESSLFVYPGEQVGLGGAAARQLGMRLRPALTTCCPRPPTPVRRPHGAQDLRHHTAAGLRAAHGGAGGVAGPGARTRALQPRLLPLSRRAARAAPLLQRRVRRVA